MEWTTSHSPYLLCRLWMSLWHQVETKLPRGDEVSRFFVVQYHHTVRKANRGVNHVGLMLFPFDEVIRHKWWKWTMSILIEQYCLGGNIDSWKPIDCYAHLAIRVRVPTIRDFQDCSNQTKPSYTADTNLLVVVNSGIRICQSRWNSK